MVCDASLNPLQLWDHENPFALFEFSQKEVVFSLEARGEGFWGIPDLDPKFLADAFELRYDLFPIPPNQVAAFEVVVNFFFTVDDGGVGVNFSDHAGNAISPVLQLELLTAPFASVAEASLDQ